jgi:hypothetical protein
MTMGALSVPKAAKIANVSHGTVRAWLRHDDAFREEIARWRSGPPTDAVRVAQARRVILDELTRRLLYDRVTMGTRDLMALYDRLQKQTAPKETASNEHPLPGRPHIILTSEQVERLWDEIERTDSQPEGEPAA